MNKDEIINVIGPCSLLCYTCFGYTDGGVQYNASKLFELYKGWYSGHVHAYGINPTEQQIEKLKRIKIFNEMLKELITQPNCTGCRRCVGKSDGCIKGHIIPECAKNHGFEKYFEEHKHIAHYIGCYNSDIE